MIPGYVLQSSISLEVLFYLVQHLRFRYSMYLFFKKKGFDMNHRYLIVRDG